MVSVTYDFYRKSYLGTVLPAAEFDTYALRAQAQLKADTFGRAENVPTADIATQLALQLCLCAVAEVLYQRQWTASSGSIQRESLGSWSRTYAADAPSLRAALAAAEALYLGSTGLLYKGRLRHA